MQMLPRIVELIVSGCKALVEDQAAMTRLRGFTANLLVGDVVTPCTSAISDLLR